VQHFELFARGERHSSSPLVGTDINGGVLAPAGTATWPGYPFGSSSVDPHCLGTAYHGNVYPTGRVLFEKEVTHVEGYADQRAEITGSGAAKMGSWFGMKFILRNTTTLEGCTAAPYGYTPGMLITWAARGSRSVATASRCSSSG
jgi:hypothetical protein